MARLLIAALAGTLCWAVPAASAGDAGAPVNGPSAAASTRPSSGDKTVGASVSAALPHQLPPLPVVPVSNPAASAKGAVVVPLVPVAMFPGESAPAKPNASLATSGTAKSTAAPTVLPLLSVPVADTGSTRSPALEPLLTPPPAPRASMPSASDVLDNFATAMPGSGSAPLQLLVNKSQVVNTKGPYKRVSVGQPEIADVNLLSPDSMLLTGKKPGTTQVIIWDDTEHAQVLDVAVRIDLQGLQDQLKALFPNIRLDVRSSAGSVIIRGTVPSVTVAEQIEQVAAPYAMKVMNFLEVSGGEQVMLQVRFAEVSRTATTALGINGALGGNKWGGGSNIGGVDPTAVGSGGAAAQSLAGLQPAVTLYGSGQIGSVYLESFVEALRENDLLRILAEPNLIAISGQEASFVAGGEFPIPVSQGAATGGAISIEYREYGVKLKFTPIILGDGRIRLKVSPEVSDLDYAHGVQTGGFFIPGLTQRKVTTTVELSEGQTFAVAGLLSSNIAADKSVTPLMGDLPLLGALFRSVRYQRTETELVVLVTPHLVEPMNPNQVPDLPGEHWKSPTENELFMEQYLGTDQPASKVSPAATAAGPSKNATPFRGQYGYVPAAQPDAASPGAAPFASGRD